MFVLRYLYILALVIWLGGMLVAGAVAAPSIFAVLEQWNRADGRVLGGQVFGEVLRRLHLVGYAAGTIMIIALALKRLLGPRPLGTGVRIGLIAIMLTLTAVSGAYLLPRASAISRDVIGPVSALPATDARREEFDRLHKYSNWLFTATAIGGLVLLAWEARE
jgi:uncharacterized membrane protein